METTRVRCKVELWHKLLQIVEIIVGKSAKSKACPFCQKAAVLNLRNVRNFGESSSTLAIKCISVCNIYLIAKT